MTDSQCIFKEKDIGLWGRLIMKEEWIMTPWYLTNWGHSLECRIALGMEIKKSGLELVWTEYDKSIQCCNMYLWTYMFI